MWMQFALAVAANGPYSGAYVQLPVWKPARVHGSEYTATYLLMAGTKDRRFVPSPGVIPPDATNQIAVGLFVRTRGNYILLFLSHHILLFGLLGLPASLISRKEGSTLIIMT